MKFNWKVRGWGRPNRSFRFYVLAIAVGLIFSAAATVIAATTIGTNISTDGNILINGDLSVTGVSVHTGLATFKNASSTLFSAYGPAYFGSTATSSFSTDGVLSLTSALTVPNGGTGAATFGQGWIFSNGGTGALSASTSPTVSYITATSTTATSTFAGDLIPKGRLILPMGELSYFSTTGTTVPIATVSDGSTNLVKVDPVTVLSDDFSEFDNGGADNGRLRYTGATTKMFHTAITISMDADGSGNNFYVFGIAKNGVVNSGCKVIRSITAVSDTGSTALHCMVSLTANDYIELYAGNLTDADDIAVKTLNLFAMGL